MFIKMSCIQYILFEKATKFALQKYFYDNILYFFQVKNNWLEQFIVTSISFIKIWGGGDQEERFHQGGMIRQKPFSRAVIIKLFEVLNSSENWSKAANLLPLKCMFRIYRFYTRQRIQGLQQRGLRFPILMQKASREQNAALSEVEPFRSHAKSQLALQLAK